MTNSAEGEEFTLEDVMNILEELTDEDCDENDFVPLNFDET